MTNPRVTSWKARAREAHTPAVKFIPREARCASCGFDGVLQTPHCPECSKRIAR